MGGSAGGGNAQLFSLMSEYGGGDEGKGSFMNQVGPSYQSYIRQGGLGNMGAATMAVLDAWGNRKAGNGGDGGGDTPPPTTPPGTTPEGQKFAWQFPQYTQTWAFTPPTPTPYMYPRPFDTKIFGNPLPKDKKKK